MNLSFTVFKVLAISTLVYHSTLQAAETDQYYAWGETLKDSTLILNHRFNEVFQSELQRLNQNKDRWSSCEDVATELGQSARTETIKIEGFPGWAMELPRFPESPSDHAEYIRTSIYGFTPQLWLFARTIKTAPSLEVNGVRFGTDKLIHFFGMGRQYYTAQLEAVSRGESEDAALIESVNLGIGTELGVLGLKGTWVFSFGDLEANFQGSVFYKTLCLGPNPRLERDSDRNWVMTPPLDWKEHVNPYWDESFNPSFYTPQRWSAVKPHLEKRCAQIQTTGVQTLMNSYLSWPVEPSFSIRYLEKLKAEGKFPLASEHNLEAICQN